MGGKQESPDNPERPLEAKQTCQWPSASGNDLAIQETRSTRGLVEIRDFLIRIRKSPGDCSHAGDNH